MALCDWRLDDIRVVFLSFVFVISPDVFFFSLSRSLGCFFSLLGLFLFFFFNLLSSMDIMSWSWGASGRTHMHKDWLKHYGGGNGRESMHDQINHAEYGRKGV